MSESQESTDATVTADIQAVLDAAKAVLLTAKAMTPDEFMADIVTKHPTFGLAVFALMSAGTKTWNVQISGTVRVDDDGNEMAPRSGVTSAPPTDTVPPPTFVVADGPTWPGNRKLEVT